MTSPNPSLKGGSGVVEAIIYLLAIVIAVIVMRIPGWVVKRTGSLFGVILSHGMTNIVSNYAYG